MEKAKPTPKWDLTVQLSDVNQTKPWFSFLSIYLSISGFSLPFALLQLVIFLSLVNVSDHQICIMNHIALEKEDKNTFRRKKLKHLVWFKLLAYPYC